MNDWKSNLPWFLAGASAAALVTVLRRPERAVSFSVPDYEVRGGEASLRERSRGAGSLGAASSYPGREGSMNVIAS